MKSEEIERVISKAAMSKPVQTNPGAFMTRTIAAIENQKARSHFAWLFNPVCKIGFSFASVALILVFFAEQKTALPPKDPPRSEASLTTLDTRKFLKAAGPGILKRKSETIQQLSACAAEAHCGNALVQNYRRKFNQN